MRDVTGQPADESPTVGLPLDEFRLAWAQVHEQLGLPNPLTQ